jgi:hypothetical protein
MSKTLMMNKLPASRNVFLCRPFLVRSLLGSILQTTFQAPRHIAG